MRITSFEIYSDWRNCRVCAHGSAVLPVIHKVYHVHSKIRTVCPQSDQVQAGCTCTSPPRGTSRTWIIVVLLIVAMGAVAGNPAHAQQGEGYWYTVRPGDSWWSISAQTGIPVGVLQAHNPQAKPLVVERGAPVDSRSDCTDTKARLLVRGPAWGHVAGPGHPHRGVRQRAEAAEPARGAPQRLDVGG